MEFARDVFILVATSLLGGVLARMVKLQPIVGFIIAGIVARIFFPAGFFGVERIAQLGLIFLLFSVILCLLIKMT